MYLAMNKNPKSKLIACDLTPKMVALSAWKMGRIHDVLASQDPLKLMGIIATLNELPETQILD